jgi:predicted nucleotidyltransferase component of viral defense system
MTAVQVQKMSKLEKFIRTNFNLTQEELVHVPRLVKRCQQEIDDSDEGQLSEYSLYDIVDDELYQIDQGK